jgi:Uma2 family endonuclease
MMATMTAQRIEPKIEPEIEPMIDLPSDGVITRADFEALPRVPRGWAWELRSGRLELTYMPVTGWHWLVVLAALEYWRGRGHAALGEQYVADSGFVRGGTGKNNFVADGVAFKSGHRPDLKLATRDAADMFAVIEAVSADSEERDSAEKMVVYAQMGVPCYWIIREVSPHAGDDDGVISMYELAGGEYKLADKRLVSQLKDAGEVSGADE